MIYDAQGNIFATGYVAPGADAATDFSSVLVKFKSDGKLDETFGTKGVATRNVAVGTNGEVMRGLGPSRRARSSSRAPSSMRAPPTRATATSRCSASTPTARPDNTFGTNGVVTLDLSAGELIGEGSSATYVADAQWAW